MEMLEFIHKIGIFVSGYLNTYSAVISSVDLVHLM